MSVKLPTRLEVSDFFETYKQNKKPWLVAGMGPSFSKHKDIDLSGYNVLGINRVVRHIPCELVSIIDYYIFDLVYEDILRQGKYLIMPYQPHFGYKPSPNNTIFALTQYRDNLKDMLEKGKLLAYNLSTYRVRHRNTPVVEAHYFSAEAAFNLLAYLGVKHIDTIGIDGGHTRAEEFKDHGPTDPRGFDLQWKGIDKTCEKFEMTRRAL